jgi:ribosomal protein L24E
MKCQISQNYRKMYSGRSAEPTTGHMQVRGPDAAVVTSMLRVTRLKPRFYNEYGN